MAPASASDINPTNAAPINTPAVTPMMAAAIRSQQLERLNMDATLKADPNMFKQYQKQRVGQVLGQATGNKAAAFSSAQDALNRSMNAQKNASLSEFSILNMGTMTDAMLKKNQEIENAIEYDKNMSRRQFEINEWANYNKLDTLFYLQLFFMCTLMGAIIMYLAKANVVSLGLAGLLYAILGAIIVIVGVSRYYYTAYMRDTKFWHRRDFGAVPDPGKGSDDNCPVLNIPIPFEDRIATALNNASNEIVSCTSEVTGHVTSALDSFGQGATNEALNIAYGNVNPLTQLGNTLSSNMPCGR